MRVPLVLTSFVQHMHVRFINDAEYSCGFNIYFLDSISLHGQDTNLLIHSTIDAHLGCFQFWAIRIMLS